MKTIIYANCELKKLREYSKAYGSAETIRVPFIRANEKTIDLLNVCGNITRTMRKGTKVLINYHGTAISERAFKLRINKAKKARQAEQEAQAQLEAINLAKMVDFAKKTKAAFQAVKERFAAKWLSINGNYSISHKESNKLAWKKQNYLGLERVDIVTLRSCIKDYFKTLTQ